MTSVGLYLVDTVFSVGDCAQSNEMRANVGVSACVGCRTRCVGPPALRLAFGVFNIGSGNAVILRDVVLKDWDRIAPSISQILGH